MCVYLASCFSQLPTPLVTYKSRLIRNMLRSVDDGFQTLRLLEIKIHVYLSQLAGFVARSQITARFLTHVVIVVFTNKKSTLSYFLCPDIIFVTFFSYVLSSKIFYSNLANLFLSWVYYKYLNNLYQNLILSFPHPTIPIYINVFSVIPNVCVSTR